MTSLLPPCVGAAVASPADYDHSCTRRQCRRCCKRIKRYDQQRRRQPLSLVRVRRVGERLLRRRRQRRRRHAEGGESLRARPRPVATVERPRTHASLAYTPPCRPGVRVRAGGRAGEFYRMRLRTTGRRRGPVRAQPLVFQGANGQTRLVSPFN